MGRCCYIGLAVRRGHLTVAVPRGGRNRKLAVFSRRENSVRWNRMKNITLSADEDLIERARAMARGQRRTLNAAFRQWLTEFTQSAGDAQSFDALMKHLQGIDAGGRFSRDERNER